MKILEIERSMGRPIKINLRKNAKDAEMSVLREDAEKRKREKKRKKETEADHVESGSN